MLVEVLLVELHPLALHPLALALPVLLALLVLLAPLLAPPGHRQLVLLAPTRLVWQALVWLVSSPSSLCKY